MEMKLSQIAELLGGTVKGNPDEVITGISGIKEAVCGQITFLAQPKYAPMLGQTKASAVIISQDAVNDVPDGVNLVVCADPSQAFTKLVNTAGPEPVELPEGIHPSAVVSPKASIGENVRIGPYVVVEDGAKVGAGTVLYPFVYIGHHAVIGRENTFYSGVAVRERCKTGDRVIIHCNSVIGSDGFGYDTRGGKHYKIPQLGNVELEDDVEIGACVTIDRARFERTLIKSGVKVDNLVQVAHNVKVGDNSILVSQCGISGSSELGSNVVVAGQSGIAGHLKIGDNVVLGARTGVAKSLEGNNFYWGSPAKPHIDEKKIQIAMVRLPDALREIRSLKKRIEELENKLTK